MRPHLTRALRLVAACFGVMFLLDVVGWWLAELGIHNLWVGNLGRPVPTLLLLFALAEWQMGETERRAVRLAALGYLLVWAALDLGVEDPRMFSRFGQPMQAILMVSVVAWTMVRRTVLTFDAPLAEPWFWIGAGLLVYFGTGVVIGPVSRLLLPTRPDLVNLAWVLRAIINIVAYLLVARGVLCSLRSGSSGGFSSPPASSSSSSAPPSRSPSSSSSAAS